MNKHFVVTVKLCYYKANISFKKKSVVLEKGSLTHYSSQGSFIVVPACTHLPHTPGSSPFLRLKVFYSFCFLHFSTNWSNISSKSLDILFKLILIKITGIRMIWFLRLTLQSFPWVYSIIILHQLCIHYIPLDQVPVFPSVDIFSWQIWSCLWFY